MSERLLYQELFESFDREKIEYIVIGGFAINLHGIPRLTADLDVMIGLTEPNMRKALDCPRERSPVTVELDIDGAPAARTTAAPSGLSRDGASAIYHRLPVPAGERTVEVRLRDDVRAEGFTHRLQQRVTLTPAQVLVIDFDGERGGIVLQ